MTTRIFTNAHYSDADIKIIYADVLENARSTTDIGTVNTIDKALLDKLLAPLGGAFEFILIPSKLLIGAFKSPWQDFIHASLSSAPDNCIGTMLSATILTDYFMPPGETFMNYFEIICISPPDDAGERLFSKASVVW